MDATTKDVLVPVDYSEKSIYGLKMASKLVKLNGGKITALNVLKGVSPIWSDFFTDEERELLLDKLKKHLHNFVEQHIDSDLSINCIIEKGKLCDTILSKVNELNISLIVMGTSTVDNIKKRIIGTNALRVVSEASCPVLTIKSDPSAKQIERIILPIDITKESREKVMVAVKMAKENNASIHIVSAYTIKDDSILRKLENHQKQVIDFITEHKIEASSSLLKVNDRVDGVLNFIDEKQGDIILITTHQQLEIIKSFLGSFAKSIIQKSKVPVLSMVPKIKNHVVFTLPGS